MAAKIFNLEEPVEHQPPSLPEEYGLLGQDLTFWIGNSWTIAQKLEYDIKALRAQESSSGPKPDRDVKKIAANSHHDEKEPLKASSPSGAKL